jgi:uncharacterized OB-fold protein
LRVTCPNCGEQNPERARFCVACSSRLADDVGSSGEGRKLVTVVFAELVSGVEHRADREPPALRTRETIAELEPLGGVPAP